MRLPRLITAFAATYSVLLPACGSDPGIRNTPRVERSVKATGVPRDVEDAFEKAVSRWSRPSEIYSAMDAQAFFYATLLSPDFREALARRDASLGGQVSPLVPPLDDCAPALLLGAYFHDSKLDDLGHRQSIWNLRLTSAAGEFAPVKVRRISRPDRRLRASFPYLDRFWVAYAITFGRPGATAGASASAMEKAPAPAPSSRDAASPAEAGPAAAPSGESQTACPAFPWAQAVLTIQSVAGSARLDFSPLDKGE